MPRATLLFPLLGLDGKPCPALHALLLSDLQDGFESVICETQEEAFTDLDTGLIRRIPICAYVCEPVHTPRLERRLAAIAARYSARAGAPMATLMDADGQAWECTPCEPMPFVSKREREAWDIAA